MVRMPEEDQLNARQIELHFSSEVRTALRDLAAAVHFSEHFDEDIRVALQRMAESRSTSVHDFVTAFPVIAEETFRHIHATGDVNAKEAWRTLSAQIPEKGFTLARRPAITR